MILAYLYRSGWTSWKSYFCYFLSLPLLAFYDNPTGECDSCILNPLPQRIIKYVTKLFISYQKYIGNGLEIQCAKNGEAGVQQWTIKELMSNTAFFCFLYYSVCSANRRKIYSAIFLKKLYFYYRKFYFAYSVITWLWTNFCLCSQNFIVPSKWQNVLTF